MRHENATATAALDPDRDQASPPGTNVAHRASVLLGIRGLLAVVFGVLVLAWPGITILALALAFAVYVLADGIGMLVSGVQARATTAGELEWTNAQLHNVAPEIREKWWSDRAEVNFTQAREIFGRSCLQIGYARAGDFLIGDAPVITRKIGHDGLGPHQGVAIGDASEICMPIDPGVIIGLGPAPASIELDREAVERYNSFQIRTFQRWLGSRPGGSSDHSMRTMIPARTVLP